MKFFGFLVLIFVMFVCSSHAEEYICSDHQFQVSFGLTLNEENRKFKDRSFTVLTRKFVRDDSDITPLAPHIVASLSENNVSIKFFYHGLVYEIQGCVEYFRTVTEWIEEAETLLGVSENSNNNNQPKYSVEGLKSLVESVIGKQLDKDEITGEYLREDITAIYLKNRRALVVRTLERIIAEFNMKKISVFEMPEGIKDLVKSVIIKKVDSNSAGIEKSMILGNVSQSVYEVFTRYSANQLRKIETLSPLTKKLLEKIPASGNKNKEKNQHDVLTQVYYQTVFRAYGYPPGQKMKEAPQ